MSRWLTFRQPREEILGKFDEAVKVLQDFRLIGEVFVAGQELWFVPNGWNGCGMFWHPAGPGLDGRWVLWRLEP